MTAKKINIKRILVAVLWIAVGTGTTVLLVAAVKNKNAKLCKGIAINIHGVNNNFFIDKKDVQDIINKFSGASAKGKTIESFNLRQMEAALEKNVWIKDAQLYFDNNDILQANVEEREPVARIFTAGGNTYYIDSSTMMLPLSEKFSARVPVFTGFPSEVKVLSKADSNLLLDVKNISIKISADSFLMAMIDQVDITAERSFEMIPKIGNQLIVFGEATDVVAKFKKLKLFYKNVIPHTGWNHYNTIDLQYDNQVVAKVNGKEEKSADSLRTLQLMQMMAANAAKEAADSVQTFAPDNDKNSTDPSLIQQSIQRDEEAEPSVSNTDEKPSPQVEVITKPVAKPVQVISKPVQAIPKPVTVKPAIAKAPVKLVIKKPVTPDKKTQKKIPKAVMKPANEY